MKFVGRSRLEVSRSIQSPSRTLSQLCFCQEIMIIASTEELNSVGTGRLADSICYTPRNSQVYGHILEFDSRWLTNWVITIYQNIASIFLPGTGTGQKLASYRRSRWSAKRTSSRRTF